MANGRRTALVLGVLLALAVPGTSQTPPAGTGGTPRDKDAKGSGNKADWPAVERLLASRREYQETLEALRAHYISTGDIERARWAEDELIQFHRINKQAFILELEVPPKNLKPEYSIPEATDLYRRAMVYKNKASFGNDSVDNQRRAELLLQQILSKYPQSTMIDDAAYQLGDIYESRNYHQYQRAAAYFERCFQWNKKTQTDARLRAAHLYEKQLNDRAHAIEIYKEIGIHETDPRRVEEAQRKVAELSGSSR
jgi:TolA-binding protein